MAFSSDKRRQPPPDLTVCIHVDNCDTVGCQCPCINKVETFKYLGVLFDQHLAWAEHIALTSSRIRKTFYIFRRLRNVLSINFVRNVFFALVVSIADYGVAAWGGAFKSSIHKIHVSINIVLRIIFKTNYREHAPPLYDKLQVPTFYHLYLYSLLTLFHKILKPIATEHPYNTRRRPPLQLPGINKTQTSHCPKYLITKILNRAPDLIICWQNKNSKVKLKQMISQYSVEDVISLIN